MTDTRSAALQALEQELREATARCNALSNWLAGLRKERELVLQEMSLQDPIEAVQRIVLIDSWLASASEVRGRLEAVRQDAQTRLGRRRQWEAGPMAQAQREKGMLM